MCNVTIIIHELEDKVTSEDSKQNGDVLDKKKINDENFDKGKQKFSSVKTLTIKKRKKYSHIPLYLVKKYFAKKKKIT